MKPLAIMVMLGVFGFTTEPEAIQYTAPEKIEEVKLHDALVPICACESTGNKHGTPQHYDKDGSVLRGRLNPDDIGMCQINLYYHEETAKSLGLDVFTVEGNIRYANYLYETEGAKPWSWSKSCWE